MLSSWAAFALTHHAIIEYSAHLEGFKTFKKYAVLGDDVVIWDEAVAVRYRSLMELMGLTINDSKSLTSDDHVHRLEFAKRIAIDGCEISGLKGTIMKQASQHVTMWIDLIQVAILRH